MKRRVVLLPKTPALKNVGQGELDLKVARHLEDDGIGMGVLNNGTPFLNQRGLARLCGVENRYIGLISSGWNDAQPSKEVMHVKGLLHEQGLNFNEVAFEVFVGRRRFLAYPDLVCMVILELFAFEANRAGQPIALRNYRLLARKGLREFIYQKTGYDADDGVDLWKIFKDRVSLTYNAVPTGFFGVFKEIADLIVHLGQQGLHIDEKFVPDISVGKAWSTYWERTRLAQRYGERARYPHNYPDYFPQATSNPQLAYCYPEEALGEFRRWFRDEYIGEGRLKNYLAGQVKQKALPEGYVERAMLALTSGD
ncbi:MAG: hypothetical protein AAFS07_04180 [Pseudomonadota bacterium]